MPKHLAYGFDGNALFQGDERSEGVPGGVCVVIGKDSPALSEIAFRQDK